MCLNSVTFSTDQIKEFLGEAYLCIVGRNMDGKGEEEEKTSQEIEKKDTPQVTAEPSEFKKKKEKKQLWAATSTTQASQRLMLDETKLFKSFHRVYRSFRVQLGTSTFTEAHLLVLPELLAVSSCRLLPVDGADQCLGQGGPGITQEENCTSRHHLGRTCVAGWETTVSQQQTGRSRCDRLISVGRTGLRRGAQQWALLCTHTGSLRDAEAQMLALSTSLVTGLVWRHPGTQRWEHQISKKERVLQRHFQRGWWCTLRTNNYSSWFGFLSNFLKAHLKVILPPLLFFFFFLNKTRTVSLKELVYTVQLEHMFFACSMFSLSLTIKIFSFNRRHVWGDTIEVRFLINL